MGTYLKKLIRGPNRLTERQYRLVLFVYAIASTTAVFSGVLLFIIMTTKGI
jgi:hypothetical protein